MLKKIVLRARDFIQSREYRRVKIARFLSGVLKIFNPHIQFIGVEHGDETQILFIGDKFITSDILAFGDFNRKGVLDSIKILESEGLPTGKLFLDIGANIGTSTIYALSTKKFSGAICVEPSPKNLKLLKINLVANDIDTKVKVFASAISNKNDAGKIFLSASNSGDNRVASQAGKDSLKVPDSDSWQSIEIPLTTFDTMLETLKVSADDVSLVWIDTQGHEGFVLSSAAQILERHVPLCMEFWPKGLAQAVCDKMLFETLKKHYTHFFDLNDASLQKRPLADLEQVYDHLFASDHHTDIVVIAS